MIQLCFTLDNCDEASIKAAKEKVEVLVGNQGLNVLINNAAILIRDQSIEVVTIENLMEHFSVNTVGTIMVCKVNYSNDHTTCKSVIRSSRHENTFGYQDLIAQSLEFWESTILVSIRIPQVTITVTMCRQRRVIKFTTANTQTN